MAKRITTEMVQADAAPELGAIKKVDDGSRSFEAKVIDISEPSILPAQSVPYYGIPGKTAFSFAEPGDAVCSVKYEELVDQALAPKPKRRLARRTPK